MPATEVVEIGTVIEVEAAQEVLVRLAGAGVLRDDHAGNEFQHLAGAQDRAVVDQLGCDHPCARGVAGAHAVLVVTDNFHPLELVRVIRKCR